MIPKMLKISKWFELILLIVVFVTINNVICYEESDYFFFPQTRHTRQGYYGYSNSKWQQTTTTTTTTTRKPTYQFNSKNRNDEDIELCPPEEMNEEELEFGQNTYYKTPENVARRNCKPRDETYQKQQESSYGQKESDRGHFDHRDSTTSNRRKTTERSYYEQTTKSKSPPVWIPEEEYATSTIRNTYKTPGKYGQDQETEYEGQGSNKRPNGPQWIPEREKDKYEPTTPRHHFKPTKSSNKFPDDYPDETIKPVSGQHKGQGQNQGQEGDDYYNNGLRMGSGFISLCLGVLACFILF